MFDVNWADPNREKVGERKARKEKEQDFQDGEDARLSKRGSTSTSTRRSSSSADKSVMTKSTADKASSWFGSVSLKKNRLSSKSKVSHASGLRIPIPEGNTVTPSLPSASTLGSNFSATSFLADSSPDSKTNLDAKYVLKPIDTSWEESEDCQILPAREPGLSRTTQVNTTQVNAPFFQSPSQSRQGDFANPAHLTAHPTAKAVQTFGADRWITKTTETIIEVKTETSSDCARPALTVPAERVVADPHAPTSLIPLDRSLSAHISPSSMYAPPLLDRAGVHTPSRRPGPIRSRKMPMTPIPPSPTRNLIKFRAHDPSRWKAPEEWDVEERCATEKGFDLEEQFSAVDRPGNDSLVDISSVQREIKKMALLVPASIIFRLDEKLADSANPAAYKETEMERKRLMLYALGALGGPCETRSPSKGTKMLALFETEATASYLAAIHPEASITHFSPSPLSALLFPNVRPLVTPILPNLARSLAPNYFSAVYCLSLPSVLSSQEIPGLLRGIHACLVTGGILHLVLINPAPATSSLGPRMRQWIEDNLLLNLERHFRCTNPRKLIPLWLRDAGLRADDSTKVTVKCQAVVQKGYKEKHKEATASKANYDEDDILDILYGGQEAAKREQQAENDLQSKVGKLLWQETWGSYVNADRWWWDDPECVEECAQLGTYWEYSIIEAAKEK